ncbi:hypothetical protein O3P69_000409 [Scylla paramamosain]|uniref:Uncharacterized protein n=1 Tax=Scylla paramamosain TaxID=85552 RepID=A0AAW0UTQ0_SCYPA
MVWASVPRTSDSKYRQWCICKHNPTRQNKDRHKDAAFHMEATRTWTREQLTAITTTEGEVRAALSTFKGWEEQEVTARLNTTLRRLKDWGRRWQVTFAPQKTELLVVSRSAYDIRSTLSGTQLTPQQELQILGVTFDSKLTY